MTVKELKNLLNTMDENSEVVIEMKVNSVEFNAGVTEVFESQNIFICGQPVTFDKEDAKRWWNI